MTLNEAREYLSKCKRFELRDHAFGDMEIVWTLDGEEVASGYFGGWPSPHKSVWIDAKHDVTFKGTDAQELRYCGVLTEVERNDYTGPDTYTEGAVMRGLTKEGVLDELTKDSNE